VQEIFDGNSNVIWGLLDDMLQVFHVKIVKNSRFINPRNTDNSAQKIKSSPINEKLEIVQPIFQKPPLKQNIEKPMENPNSQYKKPIRKPEHIPEKTNKMSDFYSEQMTPLADTNSSIGRKSIGPKYSQQETPIASHRQEYIKNSNASYSQIHASKSPIRPNYFNGSKNLKKSIGTPIITHSTNNTYRHENLKSPLLSKPSINATQFEINDRSNSCIKMTHSAITSPRTNKSISIFFNKILLCKGETYICPKISEEKEKITRNWLKLLNFTTTTSQENDSLLKNPYRNGTLLCEVFLQQFTKKMQGGRNIRKLRDKRKK